MAKKLSKIVGPLILLSAAMIWGLSFVAQKSSVKFIEPFTFSTIRLFLAAFTLLPIALIVKRKKKMSEIKATNVTLKRKIKGSICVGVCLFVGLNLQQMAFKYIEAGKVGFLTALYMLIVPILGLFLKRRPPITVWIGVALGTGALYLICMGGTGGGFKLGIGEILTILCAFAFAFHILVIDSFSDVDSIELSCGQFFVAGILSIILVLLFEHPEWQSIKDSAISLLYVGVCSSAMAFTFQIIGQKKTEPVLASMLLCLESVFSVIFSLLLPPHEMMSVPEYIGCGIMFAAILIAQIPAKKSR